jgi:hypothetical protein
MLWTKEFVPDLVILNIPIRPFQGVATLLAIIRSEASAQVPTRPTPGPFTKGLEVLSREQWVRPNRSAVPFIPELVASTKNPVKMRLTIPS